MKYLAIDSSLAHTGIAIGEILPDGSFTVEAIDLHETEKTKNKQVRASSDTIKRCRETYEFLQGYIRNIKPAIIFVETPSGSQSASGMKSYGVTCQLIASLYPEPIEVTPDEVKVAALNSKTASKRAIINWAHDKYPDLTWIWRTVKGQRNLQDNNEHMADAIAVVHAGVRTPEFKKLNHLFNERRTEEKI